MLDAAYGAHSAGQGKAAAAVAALMEKPEVLRLVPTA
jgi:hypothetical protein